MENKKQHLNDLIKEYLTLKDEQSNLNTSDKIDIALNHNIIERLGSLSTILIIKYRLRLDDLKWEDLNVKLRFDDSIHASCINLKSQK